MKNLILACALLIVSIQGLAREITPMHIVEKTSYQIGGLVNKGKIDASYLSDITTLTISKRSDGFDVTLLSPSADEKNPNLLTIPFDLNAKAGLASSTFYSKFPQGPIFTSASTAILLDLGAEAIVDHLSESPENIEVARNAQAVDLQKETTGVLMLIHLTDGRTYSIHMDPNGKVISKGF